ncbi:MAG: hypothetical protein LBU27_02970 [Candidatus Peribacteria bacterium]|jgi:hypothetical protein|nr:hypothetical protein [Candidatus Peribacteria bacterium]
MLVDIEEVKARIENLKLALKDPAFADRKIEIAVQATHAKEELTEMKRQFKNYQNTGEEGLSRLQAKFNSVNATTRSF